MKDMFKSAERIKKAISEKERILIYGDYDVDGVTSVALLSYVLSFMGASFETFIPDRLDEGYGLNVRAVAVARDHGVKLIVTVDCGINSYKEVKCANDYGIDVIVTDHHEIRENELPPAYAVLNPKRSDCGYPYKYLAGVGVAYKLARALMGDKASAVDEHLDLVALGTISDVSPMTGENRILAKEGLKRLSVTGKPGLRALIDSARLKKEAITCRHVGYIFGPRINAMGRVGSANTSLELLMCRDEQESVRLASILERENKNRQIIEKELLDVALDAAEKGGMARGRRSLVLSGENWHAGVLGIVASRVAETYDMPTILISLDGDKGKASGRSALGVNLFEAISGSAEHLLTFGGHALACGLSVKRDNVDVFRDAFDSAVRVQLESGKVVARELEIDMDLAFSQIGMKLLKELELFVPYGPLNSEPVFAARGLMVRSRPKEFDKGGFKFLATCGNLTHEAITFKKNRIHKPMQGNTVNIAFTPSINKWEGIETIQLNLKDLEILG
jgi:single-stranded-DNA-specific exonuclease